MHRKSKEERNVHRPDKKLNTQYHVRFVPEADIESGIRFTENPEYFSRGFPTTN